jgi:hypothetical protein
MFDRSKDFTLIEDAVALHRGNPGALPGLLEAVQGHNLRKFPL